MNRNPLGFVLVWAVVASAATSSNARAGGGAEVFFGLGFNNSDYTEDVAGHVTLGGALRADSHLSVGLDGYITQQDTDRLVLTAHGKLHAFPAYPIHPYGLFGLGFADIALGSGGARGSELRVMPKFGIGLELGFPRVGVYGEYTALNNYSGSNTIVSITVGLQLHLGRTAKAMSAGPAASVDDSGD